MKKTLIQKLSMASLALILPIAAFGDITDQNATLQTGQNFNFDNGQVVTSGGDIQFIGVSIEYVAGAKGGVLPGAFGQSTYEGLSKSFLQSLAALANATPIQTSSLSAGMSSGTIIAIGTNGGNTVKLLVTALSANSISFEYTTYGGTLSGGGGGGGAGAPNIGAVVNNYSFIPDGFPNSGISQSGVFIIFGTGLATTSTVKLQPSTGSGIPQSLNGASIDVNVNGTDVTPAMYYASATQIAGVMPAGTPTGNGTMTVTVNGTASNAFPITVVASAMGLGTYGGSQAIATEPGGKLISYTSSASPGDTLVFWGSGLGAYPGNDLVFMPGAHGVNQANTQFYIGGVQAKVIYAGGSGYPGVVQINATLAKNTPNGCSDSVVAVVNGVPSNFASLAVNQGNGDCRDSIFGFTGSELSQLTSQGSVKNGSLIVGQFVSPTQTSNIAFGTFSQTSGVSTGSGLVSLGSCSVTLVPAGGGASSITYLDAGNVSVTGPTGNFPLSNPSKGSYEAMLPADAITNNGGTFTFTGGPGADVGQFTATATLPDPLLTWTNQGDAANINRASGFTANWSGGTPGTFVVIQGDSSGNQGSGSYICYAPRDALTFAVPSYVTGALPSGTGTTSVENSTDITSFAASGIDHGVVFGFNTIRVDSTYQ